MKKTGLVIENNVRTLRFHQDEMTQSQLAKELGVSRQTVVAIEKGQYSPSLELAFKLSMVFEKPIDEIFYVETKKANK